MVIFNMEEYITALNVAFANCFPDDVLDFILQRIRCMENGRIFDINTLWQNVWHSTPKQIEKLLKLGADINYRLPETGSTPIMYSAQNGKVDCVTYMLERGADITIKNGSGFDVYYYGSSAKINIASIIDGCSMKRTEHELVKKNQMLEKQCHEMDGKLNYLLGMFEKMNMTELVDLSHKKIKQDNN